MRLDHLVISVSNLQNAMRDFREAGFRVVYGGKHADGITENALILFADGSYLELLALTEGHQRSEAGFKQLLHESGEGYTGYALYSDEIANDLNGMDIRGITISPIRKGGRARPDGLVLQWQMAQLDQQMQPFVIQDESPREWRVPAFGEDVVHENGALGIDSLHFHCSNFDASVARYEAIVGSPSQIRATYNQLRIGSTDILLYRNPHYRPERIEELISIGIMKMTPVPQRISLYGIAFTFQSPA